MRKNDRVQAEHRIAFCPWDFLPHIRHIVVTIQEKWGRIERAVRQARSPVAKPVAGRHGRAMMSYHDPTATDTPNSVRVRTIRWLATWFGSGLSPVAPGTAGSLAALPFAWLLAGMGGAWTLLGASGVVFVLGVAVSEAYRRTAGHKDPSEVVIDEVAGQWLTLGLVLLAAPLNGVTVASAFLAFRIADIVKPWPANAIDRRMDGGLGIMLDDMVAGLYAAGAVLIALFGLRNGIVAS